MPYLGKSMSVNAAIAHSKGLLPLSSITKEMLLKNGFTYPKVFFNWLCQKGYIKPSEFHHASVSCRMVRYYDPKRIRFVVQVFDLDSLYALYRRKITKEELLHSKNVEFVKVITSGSRLGVKQDLILFCIKVDGYMMWSKDTALDMRYTALIENYGLSRPREWHNPDSNKIVRKIIMFKDLRVRRVR
ncbi:hypothetical protein [Aminipila sp.]|uniref:hypothetical protein n=1 Tax=Aminipila sp. TaxID=2060095 RepID=UPI00289BD433|nr:hypothetical protein [Aminipila sp.]